MINRHRQPEAAVSNTNNVTPIPEQPRPTPAPVPAQHSSDGGGNGSASIYAKMARVMGMMQRIPKSGFNEHFKYEYATEGDIADAVRKAMAEVGLAFFSEIVDWRRESVEVTKRDYKTKEMYTAQKWTTYLKIRFTFACTETGATVDREWYSEADDDQDKGISKAVTLAQKYFFKSTFVISTGDPADDPDGAAPSEDAPPAANSKPATPKRTTTPRKPAQPEPQKPAAPKNTPAKADDNNAPGDVTKKILNDKSVQKAWQSSKEALNTVNKMWREGELTADMDEADMILSVIERLESHKKAEAKS